MSVRSAIRHLCALFFCVICGAAVSPQVSAQDYAAQYEEGLRKRDYVLLSQVFAGAAAQNNHAIASGALVAIAFTPLTTDSTQSCASSVGEEKAQYLALVCGMISPATHPPCNVANSCKLIADEVVRGCQLAAQMGQPDAFCPPFLTMAGVAQPANAMSNTTASAAATGNKSPSAPIPTTATKQEHRTGLVRWIMGNSATEGAVGLTVVFLMALFVAYMIKKHGFWGGIGASIKWGLFGFLTIATCGLFLLVARLWNRATTTVCPSCKQRVSMDIRRRDFNDREEYHERVGKEVWLMEKHTVEETFICPKCGHKSINEREESTRIGTSKAYAG